MTPQERAEKIVAGLNDNGGLFHIATGWTDFIAAQINEAVKDFAPGREIKEAYNAALDEAARIFDGRDWTEEWKGTDIANRIRALKK